MTAYPMSFQQLISLMISLYTAKNIRLAEQLAYHLSISLHDDLMYDYVINGIVLAHVSAKYILIQTMQQIGMIQC